MKDIIQKFWTVIIKPVLQFSHVLMRKYYTAKVKLQIGSYTPPLFVGGNTRLNKNTILGKNANFNGLTIWGEGRVEIGDNFHSGVDIWMFTVNHDYDHGNCIPYDAKRDIVKSIIIKDNVWIGSRVTILGGITIEEGAIIQAGSVVVTDIPKYAIAGGNPAKVFKYRDIEHYEMLKKEGKFI